MNNNVKLDSTLAGMGTLTIIVPYRDRLEHLKVFVRHMLAFLKLFQFRLLFIEQADQKPFNRGKLLNVGFVLARDVAGWICFHDVDMIPMDNQCDYSLPQCTTHLAGRVRQFGYALPYPEYLGGVLVPSLAEFEDVNGFSNEYWGWGNEDDDLYVRYLLGGLKIRRKNGLYMSLQHGRAVCSPANNVRLARAVSEVPDHSERRRLVRLHNLESYSAVPEQGTDISDGLRTLKYETVSRKPLMSLSPCLSGVNVCHEVVSVIL